MVKIKKDEKGRFICPHCGEIIKSIQLVESGVGIYDIYLVDDTLNFEFQDFVEDYEEQDIVHPECGEVICPLNKENEPLIKEIVRSVEKIEEEGYEL